MVGIFYVIALMAQILIEWFLSKAESLTFGMEILGGLAPLLGGVSTLILAALYYRQQGILEDQASIQEEQQKISKFEQTPYIVGPYKFHYEDGEILFRLSNTGGGVARYVSVKIEIMDFGLEANLDIRDINTGSSRVDTGFMDPDVVYPGEEAVFRFAVDDLKMNVRDISAGEEEYQEYPANDAYAAIDEYPGYINYRIKIEYSDIFDSSEDPFDREYIATGPSHYFNPDSMTLTDSLVIIAATSR